jgi:hypothetical protein
MKTTNSRGHSSSFRTVYTEIFPSTWQGKKKERENMLSEIDNTDQTKENLY